MCKVRWSVLGPRGKPAIRKEVAGTASPFQVGVVLERVCPSYTLPRAQEMLANLKHRVKMSHKAFAKLPREVTYLETSLKCLNPKGSGLEGVCHRRGYWDIPFVCLSWLL